MGVAVRKKGPDGPFKTYSMLDLNVECIINIMIYMCFMN